MLEAPSGPASTVGDDGDGNEPVSEAAASEEEALSSEEEEDEGQGESD